LAYQYVRCSFAGSVWIDRIEVRAFVYRLTGATAITVNLGACAKKQSTEWDKFSNCHCNIERSSEVDIPSPPDIGIGDLRDSREMK
jgi:hypothetical protein